VSTRAEIDIDIHGFPAISVVDPSIPQCLIDFLSNTILQITVTLAPTLSGITSDVTHLPP
jgi:hypothetical protein